MASWADRRKATYALAFFIAIILIAAAIFFSFFNRPASCSDGIQNEGEQGIDCGGPCAKLCPAAYAAPVVLWTRSAKVTSSGTYNVLAYAENPNVGVSAADAPYTFKIYDAGGVLLYMATGTAYVPASANFAVFEDGIDIGDKVPARIDFSFSGGFAWQKSAGLEADIAAASKTLVNPDTKPKLSAILENTAPIAVSHIQSIAILYDQNGNAIAFSKTLTDSIAAGGSAPVVFTWPEPLSAPVYRIEIVTSVLPS